MVGRLQPVVGRMTPLVGRLGPVVVRALRAVLRPLRAAGRAMTRDAGRAMWWCALLEVGTAVLVHGLRRHAPAGSVFGTVGPGLTIGDPIRGWILANLFCYWRIARGGRLCWSLQTAATVVWVTVLAVLAAAPDAWGAGLSAADRARVGAVLVPAAAQLALLVSGRVHRRVDPAPAPVPRGPRARRLGVPGRPAA